MSQAHRQGLRKILLFTKARSAFTRNLLNVSRTALWVNKRQQNRASGKLHWRPSTISLIFGNPFLESLTTSQAHLALTTPLALKFPRDVAPFSALRQLTPEAVQQLHSLFEPGEASYVLTQGDPSHPNDERATPSLDDHHPIFADKFRTEGPFGVAQLLFPEDLPIPEPDPSAPPIVAIEPSQAYEMVALTDIAFPSFFRPATNRLGPYFGIRSAPSNELIAMVGERLNINNFHELSGLCTHPEHRGKGYAQHLMYHLMRLHKSNGYRTYLHTAPDGPAVALYQRMGFTLLGEFQMLRLTRIS